jgi:signal transduction histidine kinase
MLFRTVLVSGEGLRQGLLLDRQRLGDWLAAQVIGDGPLAGTAVVRFGPEDPEMPGHGGHLARHRFAEPFAGLAATLRVGPLQASRSATIPLLLAGALAVVAALGVLAIHRMASVVVEFAERRSNFAAAVSHELKTPLTAIRMYGEMLRDGLVPDDASRDGYYRTITDESERLSRLIDNVLEFSRLENGRRLLATSVGSPAPVVRDVVERLGPHAERAGFTLRLALDDPLPAVRFDRDALAQILFNLVDNAVKYAGREGAGEIVVSGRALDDGRVALEVRDFGPGVSREHLGRIFEPFFRAEAELTRSTQGSGIGLSLVQQLAEAMGATVTAENAVEGGLCVRITLARAAA